MRVLVLMLLGLSSSLAAFGDRPNIVIIYADDMGYGDLAIQHPESKIPTPHLDQLAREGMRFTDGHSSSGICTPSRYALLTGQYHWRKFHDIVNSFEGSVFDAARLTLPEMLQEAGYTTACIGKWHLGWDWSALMKPDATPQEHGGMKPPHYGPDDFDWSLPIPDGPLAHGFDYYFGDDVPNFPPYTWIRNDRVLEAPTTSYEPDPVPLEGTHEGRPGPMVEGWKLDAVMPRLTEEAVQWIASREGEAAPFFLFFSWTSPHTPIVPAEAYVGATEVGPYGDFVYQSDAHAGALLKALDAHGFRENTIVIFTADNGPEHFAYQRVRKYGHRSAGELRGLKRDIWEGGHRVPFVVRWPGKVAAGAVSDALTSQVDLMATFAAILDFPLPDTAAEDSFNQLCVWQGAVEQARDSHIHNTWADGYAYREGDWLLINKSTGDVSSVPDWYAEQEGLEANPHPQALYHLGRDVGQRHNRYADEPNRVKAMLEALATAQTAKGTAPRLQPRE